MLNTLQLQRWRCTSCEYELAAEVLYSAAWCPAHKRKVMILIEGEMPTSLDKNGLRSRPVVRKADTNALTLILEGLAHGQ